MSSTAESAEKLEFRTELKQLLHIITHSLYSHREIFLRELISNASDAINRLKFDSLSHEEMLEGDQTFRIKIIPDREKGTLTISDNGIGMSREGVIENLGTIARSGTRAFLETLRQAQAASRPDMIGQFGVGFYSAFMVADRVTVLTRPAGDPAQGVKWESDGQGEFTVEPAPREKRGTDVILHLKEDAREFLDTYQLQMIVKKFSDFLEHPVVMDVEKENEDKTKQIVEEVVNSRRAIWLRSKSEVTPEEYNEFYKQISNDFEDPAAIIHYTAEGAQEYRVLLFIPAHRPFEMQWGEIKHGPRLYIQRVLIMDHCESLLPPYLCFVRGVVDSSDLPLNISRELLQQNPLLERIQKDLVRSVLKALADLKEDSYEKYVRFYQELGSFLKDGLRRDWSSREKLADLLLYESMSTEPGKYLSLAQYVEAMPADQKEIYYLIGESRSQIEASPYLESIRARGQDVLLMTDPVDEVATPSLAEYRGKRFKAVDQGEIEAGQEVPEATREAFQKLLGALKEKLPSVSDVRLSSRLKESAACLVGAEGGISAHMERVLHRMGRGGDMPASKRILELNAEHPAVKALHALYEKSPDDARVELYGRILLDQAVVAEGSQIQDPADFARRLNELMVRDAGQG